jgi:hypothetical protein
MTGRRDFDTGFYCNMKPNSLRHFLDGHRNYLYPTLAQQPGLPPENVLRARCLLR